MEIAPVQPAAPNPAGTLPSDGYSGRKLERGADDAPRLVVDRRENPASARGDTPQEAMDKAKAERDANDKATLEKEAVKLNNLFGLIGKRLQFSVHETTQRIMVKVVDSDSGDVLSEIPPEKMLDLLGSLVEAAGVIVDQKI